MKNLLILFATYLLTCYIVLVRPDDVIRFERDKEYDSLCPNNRTKCRQTETCCKTKHNSYHCCKYKNAVCCPDLYHCCPDGSTCDTEKKRCNKNFEHKKSIDTVELRVEETYETSPSTLDNVEQKPFESEVVCPNNKTTCKDTKTCCITKNGNYYCCPHKNAVCCSDKWFCCPQGTSCDLKNKKCVNTQITISHSLTHSVNKKSVLEPTHNANFLESFLSFFVKINERCGDSNAACQIDRKCCVLNNGKSGCCGLKDGVCCPNISICCPRGTICDDKSQSCATKIGIEFSAPKVNIPQTNICPDGKSECYSWQTCCPTKYGQYGCCPHKNATCCADKETCCKHNHKCDTVKHQCIPIIDSPTVPFYHLSDKNVADRKSLVIFLSNIGLETACSNDVRCQRNSTCCPLSDNKYGCCSFKSGVCCTDLNTCCPFKTKCFANGCIQI